MALGVCLGSLDSGDKFSMYVCLYVRLYVCLLEDSCEYMQCGGFHFFHFDMAPSSLHGSPPLHQVEVGGFPLPPFYSVDVAA